MSVVKHLVYVPLYKGQGDQAQRIKGQAEFQGIAQPAFGPANRLEPVMMDKRSKRAFEGFVADEPRSLKFCDLHLPSLSYTKTGNVEFDLAALMQWKFKRDHIHFYPGWCDLWQVVSINMKIIKSLYIDLYLSAEP
jgi:hypothetical protein